MAKFCPKCGKELKVGVKFCPSCGTTLKGQFLKPSQEKTKQAEQPEKSKKTKQSKKLKGAELKKGAEKSIQPVSSAPISHSAQLARPIAPIQPRKPITPPRPSYSSAPSPKKSGGLGCGAGCGIGCLVVVIIVLLILGTLVGFGYYFLFVRDTGESGGYFDIDKDKVGKTVKCGDSIACLDTNLKECARAKGKTEIEDFAEVSFEVLGPSEDTKDSCVVFAEVDELKGSFSQLESLPSFLSDKITEDLSIECLIPEKVYTEGIEKTTEYIADNMFEVCRGKALDFLSKYGVEEY